MRNDIPTPRTGKLLTAVVILGLVGALTGLAAASPSLVSSPQLGSNVNVPASKAAKLAHRMPSAASDATRVGGSSAVPTAFVPDAIPAEILGANVPVPIPASVINVTNGWLVSDGYTLVAVYAGVPGTIRRKAAS